MISSRAISGCCVLGFISPSNKMLILKWLQFPLPKRSEEIPCCLVQCFGLWAAQRWSDPYLTGNWETMSPKSTYKQYIQYLNLARGENCPVITPLQEVLLKLRRWGSKRYKGLEGNRASWGIHAWTTSGRWLLLPHQGCASVPLQLPGNSTSRGKALPTELLALPTSWGSLAPPSLPRESTGFHHRALFSQDDHTLCNLYVNEVENMHKPLLRWIPLGRLWFLSGAYTDGVSAD